jgi:hypothetical protein
MVLVHSGRLRVVGFWDGPFTDHSWPDVSLFVDSDWDAEEREFVIDYLKAGLLARTAMGYSLCRFCGIENGDSEFTDGRYVWPEGLAHYLELHGVRLPDEFVKHVISFTEALEHSERDLDWWRTSAL